MDYSGYRIIEEGAGEGGFGRVDKAEHIELERLVALKHLDPLFKDNPTPQDIERFRREAKTLAKFSHPNIPAIYDIKFDQKAGAFTIIFEWIEGPTVRQFLMDRGTMSVDQVRRWFPQVCSALTQSHERGIIHRDVKPSNLILTPNLETCYLVDFGIALEQSDVDRITGSSPIGTAGYMSPEQEACAELGPESDMYALGVVLYECLAGHRPAVGGYQPLSVMNEAIPPGVDELVHSCLANQEDRLASAEEFADRLGRALTPNPSLSTTLANGPLHEVQAALSQMQPSEYAELPVGQKLLVVSRVRSLIEADLTHMQKAVASLLTELVRVAFSTRTEDYTFIITEALRYGYEVSYGENWRGNPPLREAVTGVALECPGSIHVLVADAVLALVDKEPNGSEEAWYYNSLRVLLQNLLANPHCAEEHATRIVGQVDKASDRARELRE